MKVVTRQDLANTAAKRWKEQYQSFDGDWRQTFIGDSQSIYNKLSKLGEKPSPDIVDIIIGNSSWTDLHCDECDSSCERVVYVGEEPDYESSTAKLCIGCVYKAYSLLS